MIRPESFAVSRETFASERKQVLLDIGDDLYPHVVDALNRVGLPSWEGPVVAAALDIFDLTARAEIDEWGPVLDDMRDAFAEELGEALKLTKAAKNPTAQAETLTRWIAQMSHNAAIEAATTADPDDNIGLEWVTMADSSVRSPHKDANGQTVPTGHEFEVGGEKVLYPGQPVGNPENWINCRCLARPTMLDGELAATTITASAAPGLNKDGTPPKCKYCTNPATQYVLHSEGMAYVPACDEHIQQATDDAAASVPGEEPDPSNVDRVGSYTITASADPNKKFSTATIMALPSLDDPVMGMSSEEIPHVTLLFLGEAALFDPEPIIAVIRAVAEGVGAPVVEEVNGVGTLGADQADVVLLDAAHLADIRGAILGDDAVRAVHDGVEQFPTWIPHLTMGWPDAPRLSESAPSVIRFDRLALWYGDDKSNIYHLGGDPALSKLDATAPEKKVIHAEDPEFSQEMADALVASVPEGEPTEEVEEVAPTEPDLLPWHGVLAPEGDPSGDARQFAIKALTSRDLPLPLKAMFIDDEGHKGSVVVGRIDAIFRDGGLIKANGVWDITEDAEKARGMIERKMWRGVSVDLDAAQGEVVEAAEGAKGSIEFSAGRVCSATLCAIPAFAEAFIRNGSWEQFANDPMPSGEMVEIPDWPGAAPALALVAAGGPKLSVEYFKNPMLTEPTPMSLGEDGHIFGHLAAWEACHIAYEVCTTAPSSATDYAYFLTGQVFSDAGPVAVGQITLGGGHADEKLGMRAAMAHYDNVSTAVADITVGEDDYGIWFSGKLRDGLTDKQVHQLFAAGPSGDWRGVRFRGMESLEMVAAHAVNVQGFPIPRTRFAMEGTRQVSLTAAGILAMDQAAEFAGVMSELRSMELEHINDQFNVLKGQ